MLWLTNQIQVSQREVINTVTGVSYWLSALNEWFYSTFFSVSCSYKRFIPDSLNRTIKQRNFLTRIRISNVFRNFLNEFNSKTIQDSNITLYDLKVKYLSTLETLTQGLGRETAEPKSLKVSTETEGSPAHTLPLGDDGMGYEVQVSGTTGISWRRKPAPVSLAL